MEKYTYDTEIIWIIHESIQTSERKDQTSFTLNINYRFNEIFYIKIFT